MSRIELRRFGFRRLGRPGLFGAIFGIVLLSLVVSQAVAAGLLALIRPPPPAAMSLSRVAIEIAAGARRGRLDQHLAERPPRGDPSPAARYAARWLADRLGVRPEDIRVETARMQRGRIILVDVGSEQGGPPRLEPTLVGEFRVAIREPDGRWRSWSPRGEEVFGRVEQRFIVLFLVGALIMLPVALLLSRALARPFAQLADAADRLGRDPSYPVAPIRGPPEAERAGRALIDMARRLEAHVADRMQMVGALAHDLRTPLTRLAFRAEGLPEPQRREFAADIAEMEGMIGDTLALVRGVARVGPRVRLELVSLVERIAEDLSLTGREVTVEGSGPLVIEGDPSALRRLLTNLIENALTYGGSAEVRARREGAAAVVDVLDRGPGLSEPDLARAFEPFFRAEPSRSRHTGGMGLGLSYARMAAEAHGGTITLLNRAGGGLCARVRLPLARDAPSLEQPAGQPRTSATSTADQSAA
ncbi:MAG: HAMP domain-containing histidine kinase [Sphingomonadaceae bacterium]|uniref:sensor histidine kinase n=1 Tax=Thermaurantiacus sp. TaxID=2820283 RepID=UPI00298EE931|nr:HAMP domain-containing sensor histidine kinase [Thermaurantiacus sp.]MCS6987108.1 HAMP domain-containing histidine kinase [Sphingomonadaceae bacterium]MDW8415554.1 HAMP domain-containing sensor histidine kinase [Thermaurantiacus sp.]